jgi:hypothetical protein
MHLDGKGKAWSVQDGSECERSPVSLAVADEGSEEGLASEKLALPNVGKEKVFHQLQAGRPSSLVPTLITEKAE